MNKTLYKSAMDKIVMSDECEMKILEAAERVPSKVKNHKKRFRFITVLAAAAVVVTGTIGAAAENGGFEWIKGFFRNESFEVSDDIASIAADMENFECESPCGIEVSPIGTIAEDTAIYCMLHIDSLPDGYTVNDIKLNGFSTDKLLADEHSNLPIGVESGMTNEFGSSTTSLEHSEEDKNTLILTFVTSDKAFHDGDKVMIRLSAEQDEFGFDSFDKNHGKYADVSFNVQFGDVSVLEKNYDEYKAIEVDTKKFFIEKMLVSPLKVTIIGAEQYFDDRQNDNSLKIVMKDGSSVMASFSGFSSCAFDSYTITSYDLKNKLGKTMFNGDWRFEKPIDPDNISAVYLRDICLYEQ